MLKLVWGRFHIMNIRDFFGKKYSNFLFLVQNNFPRNMLYRSNRLTMLHFRYFFKSDQSNFLFTILWLILSFYIRFIFAHNISHSCDMKFQNNSAFILYYLVIFLMIATRGPSQSHNDHIHTMRLISLAYVKIVDNLFVWKYALFCFIFKKKKNQTKNDQHHVDYVEWFNQFHWCFCYVWVPDTNAKIHGTIQTNCQNYYLIIL